jgi:hypothetical protein
LFNGTLGTWDTELIDFKPEDPNAKPYHGRPYPVPQSQEAKLKAEIERWFPTGKLTPAQSWYTTTEGELLSIVETLKDFLPSS